MELTVETHLKPNQNQASRDVGLTKMLIEESVYHMLEEMEDELVESNQREMFKDIEPESIHLQMPDNFGELSDCQVRMYMPRGVDSGQFHLVGHRASDNSLVYTDAVMVRMVAV